VVACDPANSDGGETGGEGFELAADGWKGDRAMDDVSEEDELSRAVFRGEGGKAVNGVIGGGDREQLAGVTVGPDVAEVEIRGDEGAIFREPEDAAGVEMEGGGEGVEVGRGRREVDVGLYSEKSEIRNPKSELRGDYPKPRVSVSPFSDFGFRISKFSPAFNSFHQM
jgi:hypothetical protein